MYSHSPFSDSLSAFTPRIGSLCNAVTPGDFRSKHTTKHVKSAVIIPEYDDMEQDQTDHGMIHSNSNLSLSSASSDQDIDVDVDIDDDMMSTSSPSTSESSSPVSLYDSPRCTPIPSLPTSPCAHRAAAPISRPWSGCLSCDQPHLGRECTQSYLVHLAVESMRPSGPSPIEHICTSSCTHHHQQKHYAKPAFLKKMSLNPAGFIRMPLPETSADLESTQLGQRRLMTPVPRTSISVNVADTPKMAIPATPASKSRKSSVFTFTTPVDESTTQAAPILVNETPRLPRRSSITPIHGVSQSFVPILSTLASPRIPSHALLLTPVIDTTSQLDISIEVPTVISPIMYARQQSIHRTVSMMDTIQQEERCVGFMSPPLPSSAVVPAWHTKAKHRQAFHHVLPPIQPKKYHGVLPSSNSSISSLPSTWTQPKLMMLYAFYMFLNAAFVILLHH